MSVHSCEQEHCHISDVSQTLTKLSITQKQTIILSLSLPASTETHQQAHKLI
jgi:hypothetical protein